jgi:DNA repair exonuclease SbcCD ATPase subunit
MSDSSRKSDLMELIVKSSPSPESVDETMIVALEERVRPIARSLFHGIGELESEIKQSKSLASEIGNRNMWNPKNWGSGKKDLAAVAHTQNSISKRLFELIQEIIRVNMLSHASLIALMVEMKKGVENGFTDANGNITRLGVEGQNLAETATQVISGILDASRDTQERIDQNSEGIRQINQELDVKAKLDSSQDEAIARLEQQAVTKDELDSQQSEAIANLEKIVKAKDELDSQQNEAIANLEKIAKARDELDSKLQVAIDEQKETLEKLTVQFALMSKGLKDAETALQQHQYDTSGQLAKLRSSLQNWRWATAVLVLVPIVWLAIITFR